MDYCVPEIDDFDACLAYRKRLTKMLAGMKIVCDKDDECRSKLQAFAIKRGLPLEFLDSKGIFYMTAEMALKFDEKYPVKQPDTASVPKAELRDKYNLWRIQSRRVSRFIGASVKGKLNILADRVIYPLYSYMTDENGKALVCGICGNDGSPGAMAKYIYCNTPYFFRSAYMYGEEELLRAAQCGVLFMAEGLVDKLWMEKEINASGHDWPVFASCGVTTTIEKMTKLRFVLSDSHLMYFPDRDKSGNDFTKELKQRFADNMTVVYVSAGNKDPADYFSGKVKTYDSTSFLHLLDEIVNERVQYMKSFSLE